VKNKVIIST
jgi:hypothetical protein